MWEKLCGCCQQKFGTPTAFEQHLKDCAEQADPETTDSLEEFDDWYNGFDSDFLMDHLPAPLRRKAVAAMWQAWKARDAKVSALRTENETLREENRRLLQGNQKLSADNRQMKRRVAKYKEQVRLTTAGRKAQNRLRAAQGKK